MSINPEAESTSPPERDWDAEFTDVAVQSRIPLSVQLEATASYQTRFAKLVARSIKENPDEISRHIYVGHGEAILSLLQRNLEGALPEQEKPEAGLYTALFRQGFGATERVLQFGPENNAPLNQRELFNEYKEWQEGDATVCHHEMSRYLVSIGASKVAFHLFSGAGKIQKAFTKTEYQYFVPESDDVIVAPGRQSWVQGPRNKGILCALFFIRAHTCANLIDDELNPLKP